MKEFFKLNKKILIESYLWIAGVCTLGFSIYLYFFHKQISSKWIFIVLFLILIIIPIIIIGIWSLDWFTKRKYKNQILNKKPYNELSKIGFTKNITRKNSNGLVDYVLVAEINECEIIFDLNMKNSKIVEFEIYGFTNHLSNQEFLKKIHELKSNNIDFNYFGFTKKINTKKEVFNSIQQLEKALIEYTYIVRKIKFEPIPYSENKKGK